MPSTLLSAIRSKVSSLQCVIDAQLPLVALACDGRVVAIVSMTEVEFVMEGEM